MIPLIAVTFMTLPLAHVIRGSVEQGVLVLHGGLFSRDDVSLEDIKQIERRCEPPEQGIMCELLWSDPQPMPGRSLNPRGVALCFGPDVTSRFPQVQRCSKTTRQRPTPRSSERTAGSSSGTAYSCSCAHIK